MINPPKGRIDNITSASNSLREFGDIAQLGERLPCTQEVTGSIPVISTKFFVGNCIS